MKSEYRPLFGLSFYSKSKNELLAQLKKDLSSCQEGMIVTPNVSFFHALRHNRNLQELIQGARYVISDSRYVSILYWLAFREAVTTIPGSDLLPLTLEMAQENQIQVSFIGSSMTSESLKNKVIRLYPNLNIRYINTDKINLTESQMIEVLATTLSGVGPHLIVVALGFPKQELLSKLLFNHGVPGIFLNVGMGLDYLMDQRMRAPKFIQLCMLEWAWRIFQEPKRMIRRYVIEAGPEYFRELMNIFLWRRS